MQAPRFRIWLWFIRLIGLIVPRRVRADWRQEWESELQYREAMLADWGQLDWRSRIDLTRRSSSAFWDAVLLQHKRLEDEVFQDLRYALRMLAKKPGFTFIVIGMLALGIGANTAIFSVVNGVLLRPLPYRSPHELIRFFESFEGQPKFPIAMGNFQDFRDQNKTLSGLALFTRSDVNLAEDDRPERLTALGVTSDFFNVLGVEPLLGRFFQRDEELPGKSNVIVLSHRIWQRRFQSDPAIVGKTLQLSGRPFTVVGVTRPGLQHVGGDYRSLPHGESVDLWWSLELPPQAGRGAHFCNGIARLKPNVTPAEAQADFNMMAARLTQQFPKTHTGWSVRVESLHEELVGRSRTTLLVLLGAVFFVLLIACVNVANLLLARATSRERETAIRSALGAGTGRLTRQLLTEGLLLSSIGGVVGVSLCYLTIRLLRVAGPEQLPRLHSISIDGRILAFTLVLTLLTGIIFGLAPALQAGRINLNELLKEGGRSASRGARQIRIRNVLVVTEVALAMVLLIGAGLLLRGFLRLHRADPGFRSQGVVTASISLPRATYREVAAVASFQDQLLTRIAALPGVESVGMTSDLPWTGYDENAGFRIEGRSDADALAGARYHFVSAGYFQTVGVPLIAGRFIDRTDRADTPLVVTVNQSLAKRYWPNESPVGRRITFASKPAEKDWFTVVGVVGDVKDSPTSPETVPAFYWSTSQRAAREIILAWRSPSGSLSLIEQVRREVRAIDSALPLADVRPLAEIEAAAAGAQRFTLWLVGLFAVVALVLAAAGIYSVLSYVMAQRTQEIGIRVALGARSADVVGLVIRQGMRPAMIGGVVGLVGAFGLTRLMQNLLYGVSATDPLTFAGIALLLTVVAFVSCYIPARRASKVDPLIALRDE